MKIIHINVSIRAVLKIMWVLSTKMASECKKRRILIMKVLKPEIRFSLSNKRTRLWYYPSYRTRNRKYITAKKKGKISKIGNKRRRSYNFIIANASVTYLASKVKASHQPFKFDTDSVTIGVDNHCSKCMSNNIDHFITELSPTPNTMVVGAGGNLKVKGEGTIVWKIQDDDGSQHDLTIKDCLYVPDLQICLLSPQHWAQQARDDFPKKDGTWCATYAGGCQMQWNQRKYTKTIQHDPKTNTPRLYTVPRSTTFRRKLAALDLVAKSTIHTKTHAFCVDLENKNNKNIHLDDNGVLINDKSRKQELITEFLPPENIPTPREIEQDSDTSALTPKGEYLRWHYRLGHLSYSKMTILILLGYLPKKLLTVKPPMCACCKIGAMTKVPYRVKGIKNIRHLQQVNKPGQCVSMDQMESRTPGFIGVLRGFLLKQRYTCATIFVDHYSDLTYTHLQRSTNMEHTLEAKRAFQAYTRRNGVNILHYHSDNGRFADKKFLQALADEDQTISFCAANAHFQNGKAEKRIRAGRYCYLNKIL